MSSYGQYRQETVDTPRTHRTTRRAYDPPRGQYAETTYVERRDAPRSSRRDLDLVRRPREDSDISIEEVQREFPPGADYDRRGRRARSVHGDVYGYGGDPRYGDLVDDRDARPRRRDDKRGRGRSLSRGHELAAAAAGAGLAIGGKELWDRQQTAKTGRKRSRSRIQTAALGVAGAVAADFAAKQYSKRNQSRDRGRSESDDSYGDRRPKQNRRKSIADMGEAALGALGLGAAAGGGHGRSRDDPRRSGRRRGSRSSSSSSDDSRERSKSQGRKSQAAKAALTAAAAEAWRGRNDPGGWLEGEKARRILTAAAGAGGVDALVDRNPDKHSKRHTAEGAIGGLLLNRVVNGSRADSRARSLSRSRSRGGGRGGRSRSRGDGGGGGGGGNILKDLGVAGLAAGAAKKFMDSRKDRSRSRGRSYSSDSSGSYSPPRQRGRGGDKGGGGIRDRSRSVLNRGLSRLGLRTPSPVDHGRPGERGGGDNYGQSRSMPKGGAGGGRARSEGGRSSSSNSDTDSEFSLSEEERARKKTRGKELLTGGLATIATIHAAHGIYQSMEKRDARTKAVAAGEMSPEEAKKKARKGNMQDIAAVGIAALGVKGAYSEWQEVMSERKEFKEQHEKVERHRAIAQRRQQQGGVGGKKMHGANSHRNSSAPDLASQGYGNGPVYADGNPYAAAGGGGGGRPSYDGRRY